DGFACRRGLGNGPPPSSSCSALRRAPPATLACKVWSLGHTPRAPLASSSHTKHCDGLGRATGELLIISRRRYEPAHLASKQFCKGDRRGVFPIRPHDLNSDRQSFLGSSDGRDGGRAAGKRRGRNPVQEVHVFSRPANCGNRTVALGLSVIVRERYSKRDRREENVHIIEVSLPLRPERQSLQVLLLPIRE